jgi:hypothetical protein
MNSLSRNLSLICFFVFSGCAAETPTVVKPVPRPLSGEQIMRESQGMAQLGQRHNEGESLIKSGEDLINQGNQMVAEGQRKVSEGKRIIQESEQGYGAFKQ